MPLCSILAVAGRRIANNHTMKQILLFSILGIIQLQLNAQGQSTTDEYIEFLYGEQAATTKDVKTKLVTGDISVSTTKPLIITSPNEKDTFNIYMFNRIFETQYYKAFLFPLDDPFKPRLLITDKDSTQLDELQLIGNAGDSKKDYEIVEEARIVSPSDISLTSSVYTWTLDKKGKRIKNSRKVSTTVNRYRITEKGTIEKVASK